jgi:hypothetical protein
MDGLGSESTLRPETVAASSVSTPSRLAVTIAPSVVSSLAGPPPRRVTAVAPVQRSPVPDAAQPKPISPMANSAAHQQEPKESPSVGLREPPTVQRETMPVVHPLLAETVGEPRSLTSMESPAAAAPIRGKLVVLPPVRSTTPEQRADVPASSARSVIAESPRPMSLQRMFEQFQRVPDPVSTVTAAESPTLGVQRAHDDGAVITITFNSPVVQRELEAEAQPAETPEG